MAEDSRGSRTGSGPRPAHGAGAQRACPAHPPAESRARKCQNRHCGSRAPGPEGDALSSPRGSERPSAARTHPRLLAGGEAPERRREAVAGAGRPQACRCRVARRGAVAAPARAARPRKCSPLPCERRGPFFLGCRGPLARSTRLSHRVDPPRF